MSPIPSRYNPIPRKVSEASLRGFEKLRGKSDASTSDSLDLAEFEGFTFHLLEQDRYEEMDLEFKFSTPPENYAREDHESKNSTL